MSLFNPLEWVATLIKPISDAYKVNQERKSARESAKAKIKIAKQDNDYKLELNEQEWEALAVQGLDKSWKDEYVTVSVVSVFNLYVLGGIMAAFGHPELLQGMAIATNALVAAEVDVGFLLSAVVLAAIGLKVWRR